MSAFCRSKNQRLKISLSSSLTSQPQFSSTTPVPMSRIIQSKDLKQICINAKNVGLCIPSTSSISLVKSPAAPPCSVGCGPPPPLSTLVRHPCPSPGQHPCPVHSAARSGGVRGVMSPARIWNARKCRVWRRGSACVARLYTVTINWQRGKGSSN